jgi:hypothetical protein
VEEARQRGKAAQLIERLGVTGSTALGGLGAARISESLGFRANRTDDRARDATGLLRPVESLLIRPRYLFDGGVTPEQGSEKNRYDD